MELQDFKTNIDLTKAFSTKVMYLNDEQESCSNGYCLIEPNTDGPPIHYHPNQEEVFKVIDGSLQVYKKNKWVHLEPGDSITIEKKVAHSYRNRGKSQCMFYYELTPKGKFTEMLLTFEDLMANNQLVNDKSLKSKIYLSLVFKKHKTEIVSVNPPQIIINFIAGIGKLLGYSI